jgi:hypothetical protein
MNGPARSVTGAAARASAGTAAVHARLNPVTGHIACVTNGFSPFRIACGYQPRDQT